MTEEVIEIRVNAGEAKNEIKKVAKELNNTKEASNEVSGALNNVTGGAISKFKGLYNSLKTVITGFNLMKVAIIGTGIGALLVAIVAVKQAFTSSEAGQDKFAKLMGAIGQVTSKLIDTLASFGDIIIDVFENPKKAIKEFGEFVKSQLINRFVGFIQLIPKLGQSIDLVFKGKFKEAGIVATNAIGKISLGIENTTKKVGGLIAKTKEYTEELKRQFEIGQQIADMRDKSEDLSRDLIVKRAKADRDIADLRDKAEQKDKYNLKERISLLRQAQALENDITDQEIEAAKLKRDALLLEAKQTKTNTEGLLAIEQAKADVINLDTKRLESNKSLTRKLQSLNAEQLSDEKTKGIESQKILDEQKAIKAESLKQAQDLFKSIEQSVETPAQKEKREYEEKKLILEQNNLSTETLTKIHKEYLQKIEDDANAIKLEKELEFNSKLINAEENLKNAKINAITQTASLIGAFAGKNKALAIAMLAVEKGLAIAQIITSASKAILQSRANLTAVPIISPITGLYNPAHAIQLKTTIKDIIATKLTAGASIATILAQTINGGNRNVAGSDSSNYSGGFQQPQAQAPSFNIVGQTNNNQLANAIQTQVAQQPLRAYVVSADITTSQQLERNILQTASFG